MNDSSTDAVWVEVDEELIQAIDTLAQQYDLPADITLQKCLISGINHYPLDSSLQIN